MRASLRSYTRYRLVPLPCGACARSYWCVRVCARGRMPYVCMCVGAALAVGVQIGVARTLHVRLEAVCGCACVCLCAPVPTPTPMRTYGVAGSSGASVVARDVRQLGIAHSCADPSPWTSRQPREQAKRADLTAHLILLHNSRSGDGGAAACKEFREHSRGACRCRAVWYFYGFCVACVQA